MSNKSKFMKLEKSTLIRILKYYGLKVSPDMNIDELVSMTERCFKAVDISDKDVLSKFCQAIDSKSPMNSSSKKARLNTSNPSDVAKPGEQVAARLPNEDGSRAWILANILEYDLHTQTYEVQDEDDNNRIATLPLRDVRRLVDSGIHFRKHDKVLAVFPDTTSFYCAVIVKSPKPPSQSHCNWDIIVRFDDDDDNDEGIAPARRIPARFVVPRQSIETDDDF